MKSNKIYLPFLFLLSMIICSISCSDDSINDTSELNTLNKSNNNNNIDAIISSIDFTIQTAIESNLSDDRLGEIFISNLQLSGVDTFTISNDVSDIELSEDYWIIANQIGNADIWESSDSYKNNLIDLKSNLDNYNLSEMELRITNDNIDFMIAFVDYMSSLEYNNLAKSDCDGWWDCWGRCAAAIIGGAIIGAIGGCGSIGGVGAAIGSIGGPPGIAIGAVVGCVVGGAAGLIGGALTGAAAGC